MIAFPHIDPVAVSVGPLQIHWYGLMYLLGFGLAWLLLVWRAKKPGSGWTTDQVSDLIFYGAIGVIAGGRLGYCLFYNLPYYASHPLQIFYVWDGGMSFHGGAIGVLIALWFFARKNRKSYFAVADFGVPIVPLGLGAGRIGNFINAELWGRPTDTSWAMVFPTDPYQLPRHPSMLYEFALEGVVLFLVLWIYSRKPRPAATVTGLFGVGYGLSRILVEFYREPDAHLGYLAFDWLTMGQLLSLPLVLAGLGLIVWGVGRSSKAKVSS